jgi:hypothetical protein
MEFEMQIMITLTQKDLEEAVKDFVAKQEFGLIMKTIGFDASDPLNVTADAYCEKRPLSLGNYMDR